MTIQMGGDVSMCSSPYYIEVLPPYCTSMFIFLDVLTGTDHPHCFPFSLSPVRSGCHCSWSATDVLLRRPQLSQKELCLSGDSRASIIQLN